MPHHMIMIPADPATGKTLDDTVIGVAVLAGLVAPAPVTIDDLKAIHLRFYSAITDDERYAVAVALAGYALRFACDHRPVCP